MEGKRKRKGVEKIIEKGGGGEDGRLTSLITKMAECHEQLGRVDSNGLTVQDPPWRKRYATPLRRRAVAAFWVYSFLRRLQVISPYFLPSPFPQTTPPPPPFLPEGERRRVNWGGGIDKKIVLRFLFWILLGMTKTERRRRRKEKKRKKEGGGRGEKAKEDGKSGKGEGSGAEGRDGDGNHLWCEGWWDFNGPGLQGDG